MARVSTNIRRIAAAAFTLVAAVHAQTPTQTWNIAQATSATTNAGCVNGLANPADPNGFYVDPFGATYAIRCQQSSNGFVYDNVGTNAQGAYGCSKGCDNRPNCKGWHFEGTQSSGTTGSGRCYFRSVVGQFSSNTSVYAGAELISNGTPRLPCPYYNNTIFTDTQNYQWRIRCGFDTQATDTGTPLTTGTYNMTDCMRGCNSFLNAPNPCSQFSYSNAGVAIPPDGQPAGGNCYYKSGNAQEIGGGTALAAYATRVATTPVASGFSTVTHLRDMLFPLPVLTGLACDFILGCHGGPSSLEWWIWSRSKYAFSFTFTLPDTIDSTSTAPGVCTSTGAVVPPAPTCPGSSNQSFRTPCGTNYTVYCSSDTPDATITTANNVASLSACMAACDAQAGCVAATYLGNNCYLKSAFTQVNSGSATVIVRYIPPNPNYAIPPPMGSVNASTGCGKPLFGGLVAGGGTVSFTWTTAPDGFQRTYRVHIPQFYDPTRASPLIFGFSGNGGTAANIETQTRYSTAGLNPYGIAVYVQGVGATTGYISNPDYGPTSGDAALRGLDDVSFMKQFIPWLTDNFCVDVGRIWATGHSNGGGFVQVMACDPYLSTVISVFSGSSAAMYTNFTSGNPDTITPVNTPTQAFCLPGRNNVAYIEVHGTSDTTISYYGDIRRGRLLPSIPQWQREWALRQGYPTTNVSTPLNIRGSVGIGGVRYEYGAPQGILTQVMLTGHVHEYATTANTGFDSSQEFMDFFYRQTSSWGTGRTPAISSSSTASPLAMPTSRHGLR
ncbi:Putative PAN/Apple domain, alpha/Beta hydrolase, feruloyl esterase B/C/D [Septoria linicola]|uniref:feruloyl esterase n=1 Tax=Septoria linicola TaxID=215465 RepID=A0A9Q9AD95_9PEZI|nr:putative PAN/Apple domain, alpha/Beta hydrolase, feruloyl esterase B/C/D [Septoria linicola]USW47000.1 Putative PAN/Apple domain, alpha/Beta hydrolase, feruloyl esterase B/C/D [Septoria linicola]